MSHCPHLAVEESVVEISSSRGGEAAREQELRHVVTSFSPLSKTLEKTHIGALVKSSFGVLLDSEYERIKFSAKCFLNAKSFNLIENVY